MVKKAKCVIRKPVGQKRRAVTQQVLGRVPRSMLALRRVGPRLNVLQIVVGSTVRSEPLTTSKAITQTSAVTLSEPGEVPHRREATSLGM